MADQDKNPESGWLLTGLDHKYVGSICSTREDCGKIILQSKYDLER